MWAATRRLPGTRLLIVLLVAKIALGSVLVDRGFEARYYANGTWSAPHARSTTLRGRPYTRLDDRLAFGEGRADLPLHFYNDVHFNFYQPTEPNRERLPYSVVWEGFFRAEDDRATATFYAIAEDNAAGGVWIDGEPVVVLDRASRTGSIVLSPAGTRCESASRRLRAPIVGSRRARSSTTPVVPSTARAYSPGLWERCGSQSTRPFAGRPG